MSETFARAEPVVSQVEDVTRLSKGLSVANASCIDLTDQGKRSFRQTFQRADASAAASTLVQSRQ